MGKGCVWPLDVCSDQGREFIDWMETEVRDPDWVFIRQKSEGTFVVMLESWMVWNV